MCMGSKPKTAELPPAPPPPEQVTESNNAADVKKAQDKAAAQAKLAKGTSSTVLTGPMGDTSAPELKKKTLLGS
jgi:hypothetical protein